MAWRKYVALQNRIKKKKKFGITKFWNCVSFSKYLKCFVLHLHSFFMAYSHKNALRFYFFILKNITWTCCWAEHHRIGFNIYTLMSYSFISFLQGSWIFWPPPVCLTSLLCYLGMQYCCPFSTLLSDGQQAHCRLTNYWVELLKFFIVLASLKLLHLKSHLSFKTPSHREFK